MKMSHLLVMTILSGTLYCSTVEFGYARGGDSITKEMKETAARPVSKKATKDMAVAGQRFVEHVNYARIALAVKDRESAKKHLQKAQRLATVLKSSAEKPIEKVQSGRVVYKYDTPYADHYFPIEAGPIELKKIDRGPIWAKDKGVAITDAEIVYLTLDFNDEDTSDRLQEALDATERGDTKMAQENLEDILDDVVSVDESVDVPLDKARDNIALARNFIAARNYDGARYALRHADEALDDMEDDNRYVKYRKSISSMRKEVSKLEDQVAKKDPTLLNKVDKTLEKWGRDLQNWAN